MKNNEIVTFAFNPEAGVWNGAFNEKLSLMSCSKNELNGKPIYLSIMSSREQLQPILDNPHLFDIEFINAVRLLIMHYENATYE